MEAPAVFSLNTKRDMKQPMTGFSTDLASIEAAREFHRGLPGYAATPLHSLSGFAGRLGVRRVLLKDESKRFGLNAFKALGASLAVARIAERNLPFEAASTGLQTSQGFRKRFAHLGRGSLVFVTATDGNHGRAVAWAAKMLGARSVVFMPKGAAAARVEAIRAEGAEVVVTGSNYDDAVRTASEYAAANGCALVQDTSWEGYIEVPDMIMRGYLTILSEISEQLTEMGEGMPSHVILQAGVGSFAGSMLAGFERLASGRMPQSIIVEPMNAACYYRSASGNDRGIAKVSGDLDTIMAGLACGEPNPRAWAVIMRLAAAFAAVSDSVAEEGMRILANPTGGDPKIISGESGAVGAGLLSRIMSDPGLKELKGALGLAGHSSVLLISTEGDTDPEGYRRITGGD